MKRALSYEQCDNNCAYLSAYVDEFFGGGGRRRSTVIDNTSKSKSKATLTNDKVRTPILPGHKDYVNTVTRNNRKEKRNELKHVNDLRDNKYMRREYVASFMKNVNYNVDRDTEKLNKCEKIKKVQQEKKNIERTIKEYNLSICDAGKIISCSHSERRNYSYESKNACTTFINTISLERDKLESKMKNLNSIINVTRKSMNKPLKWFIHATKELFMKYMLSLCYFRTSLCLYLPFDLIHHIFFDLYYNRLLVEQSTFAGRVSVENVYDILVYIRKGCYMCNTVQLEWCREMGVIMKKEKPKDECKDIVRYCPSGKSLCLSFMKPEINIRGVEHKLCDFVIL